MFAQLAEQDGVDAGDLLALAGHVLRVHLPRRNTPPIFSSKLYVRGTIANKFYSFIGPVGHNI